MSKKLRKNQVEKFNSRSSEAFTSIAVDFSGNISDEKKAELYKAIKKVRAKRIVSGTRVFAFGDSNGNHFLDLNRPSAKTKLISYGGGESDLASVLQKVRKEFDISNHRVRSAVIITASPLNNLHALEEQLEKARNEDISVSIISLQKKELTQRKAKQLLGSYVFLGENGNLSKTLESIIRPASSPDDIENPFKEYSNHAVSLAVLVSDSLKKKERVALEKAILKSRKIVESGFRRNSFSAFSFSCNGSSMVVDKHGTDTASLYEEASGAPLAKALRTQRHHLNTTNAKKTAILFTTADAPIRSDVAKEIKQLQSEGVHVLVLLYGDNFNQELILEQFPGVDYRIGKIKQISDAVLAAL